MPNNFIPIEKVMNVYDGSICWYYIPGFNGYEISNNGIIRSMKHYRRYPFGLLIRAKKVKNNDPVYELSNNNNERVLIKLSELKRLSQTNPYHMTGYPRATCITDGNPRNQSIFLKRPKQTNNISTEPSPFKFNITHEDLHKDNYVQLRFIKTTCPIESINEGEEYYGRKNY